MNEGSRKGNVVRNMFVGTLFQIISLAVGFINRTYFIKLLSAEYLGVNSLFTNILTILSFAELGIGNAIVFNLYKPIANRDEKKINVLLRFYKKTYTVVALIMIFVGLILVPFIPSLIKEMPNIKENIYIIYILFLLDTSIQYFFTFRLAIITADQKNYIVVKTTQLMKIFQLVLQIVVLYFTKNYYYYLLLQLASTIFTYSFLSFKSKKMYPFTKNIPNDKLPDDEKKSIFANVKALFVYKIGSVILNGTDNIIISKCIGLVAVGLYSNYYLIVNALTQVIAAVFNAFTASIGNLIAKDGKEKNNEVFYQLFYFTIFVYGICSSCLYFLFNDFVMIWLGEEYLLSNLVVLAIVLHFFVNGVQFSSFTYRQTAGLFTQYRWSPILSSVANIVLSVWLAKYIGLAGILFATSISRLITAGWIDPVIVFKNVLKENPINYFKNYLKYVFLIFVSIIPCWFFFKYYVATNIFKFIVKGIGLSAIYILMFIFLTGKTNEYKSIKSVCFSIFNKLLRIGK